MSSRFGLGCGIKHESFLYIGGGSEEAGRCHAPDVSPASITWFTL
jgi:hypothetical protein